MPLDPKRVQALFAAAVEIPDAAARAAWLSRECGEDAELRKRVDLLLAAHDDSAGLPAVDPQVTGAYASQAKPAGLAAGTVFAGRYKIREKLGEGGMGTVYVAEQTEPVQRRIALKIIKTDLATDRLLARFEQERQALALMDHPNIAKVLDAGVADGTPYFAMELIKGVPITKYCDEAKLTPKQRLELFIPVCQAVQHAHQKGIIHRDLKPSNILIGLYDGRPVPKVIDFGVAKATGPKLTDQSVYTEVGSLIGTLEYMSPEQAELNNLDIDTRTDIYALGVVLYELLTGTVPHSRKELKSAGFAEMLRIIKEVEPPKPSTRLSGSGSLPSIAASRHTEPKRLTALLRNDLDWIVMKALEKDRSRRYETANGFAMDIQRYLADEPVLAGPPSAGYRLRKFVKRNRLMVVAAGIVLMALVGGLAMLYGGVTAARYGLLRARESEKAARADQEEAEKQRAIAVQQRTRAEKARDRTRDVLDAMVSEATGNSLATQEAISEEQKKFLQDVLGYYREFAGENPDDESSRSRHAGAAYRVGLIEHRFGRNEESAAAFRIARDGWASLAADFPAVAAYRYDLARSHNDLGVLLRGLGERPAAEEQYRKALAIREKFAADFPAEPVHRQNLAATYLNLGNLLDEIGKRSDAAELHRKGLSIQEKLAADFPALPAYRKDLATSLSNLGVLLVGLGERAAAVDHYRRGLAIREKLAADFPAVPDYRDGLAASRLNLGNLLAEIGRRPEAEEQYRKGLAIWEKLAADFPAMPEYRHRLAVGHNNLGVLLKDLGRQPEAEDQYRKGLAIQVKLAAEFPAVPAYRHEQAASHSNLGVLLGDLGKRPEAEDQYRKGLAIQIKLAADFPAVPAYRQALAASHHNLGNLLTRLGERTKAEEQHRKSQAIKEKLAADFPAVPEYRQDLAKSHFSLGGLLNGLGKRPEAEDQYRKGLAIREKLAADFPAVPAYRDELAVSHNSLGLLLDDLGKRLEAKEQYRKASATWEKLAAEFPAVPAYQVGLGGACSNYGNSLRNGGNPAASLKWFGRAIDCLQSVLEKEPRDATAKTYLRNSHWNRALAHDQLQKFAEAVQDWKQVVTLSEPDALAWANFQHGIALERAGDTKAATVAFDRSLALREQATKAAGPDAREPRYLLALHLIDRGIHEMKMKRHESAAEWFARSISSFTSIAERWPSAEVSYQLRWSHQNRAEVLEQLKRYQEAAAEWNSAQKLAPMAEVGHLRLRHAQTLVKLDRSSEAITTAGKVIAEKNPTIEILYQAACVYSLVADKLADKNVEYSDRAMELLQKAVKAGYKNAAQMKKDTDLDPLRGREDFKKLLADLEAKFPPAPTDKK